MSALAFHPLKRASGHLRVAGCQNTAVHGRSAPGGKFRILIASWPLMDRFGHIAICAKCRKEWEQIWDWALAGCPDEEAA